MDTPTADVDAREGGSYLGSRCAYPTRVMSNMVLGEIREVRPPERLAYTWRWEEGPDPVMAGSEDTLVEIDFVDDGDGTLVRLTHSGFASEQVRDMHAQGWQGVLANLEARVFS